MKPFSIGSNILIITVSLCLIILGSLGVSMYNAVTEWKDGNNDKAKNIYNFFVTCISVGVLGIVMFSTYVASKVRNNMVVPEIDGLNYALSLIVPIALITMCSLGIELHGMIQTIDDGNKNLVEQYYITFATFTGVGSASLAVVIAYIVTDSKTTDLVKSMIGGGGAVSTFFTY